MSTHTYRQRSIKQKIIAKPTQPHYRHAINQPYFKFSLLLVSNSLILMPTQTDTPEDRSLDTPEPRKIAAGFGLRIPEGFEVEIITEDTDNHIGSDNQDTSQGETS